MDKWCTFCGSTQHDTRYCPHEAVVEDQINDFQLVDREWLEIENMLRKSRN